MVRATLASRLSARLKRVLNPDGSPSPLGRTAEAFALGDRLEDLAKLAESIPTEAGEVVGADLIEVPDPTSLLVGVTTVGAQIRSMLLTGIPVRPTLVISTPYVVQDSDTILLMGAGSAVVTLPAIATHLSGHLAIKDVVPKATATPLTVNPDGAETIDGAASLSISSNYASVTLVADGAEWYIV